MGMVHALWRRRAGAALEGFGITLSQYQLIQLARMRGAVSPSAAAEELCTDRATMTLVARKCVAAGWLGRRRSKEDRRSSLLKLTGQGEELLDRIEAARALGEESLGDPFDVLDSGERAALMRILDKVQRRARDVLGSA